MAELSFLALVSVLHTSTCAPGYPRAVFRALSQINTGRRTQPSLVGRRALLSAFRGSYYGSARRGSRPVRSILHLSTCAPSCRNWSSATDCRRSG